MGFEALLFDLRLLGFLSADVALEEVVLVGPRVSATVDESGEMNLLALLSPPEVEEPGEDVRESAGEEADDSEGLLFVEIALRDVEVLDGADGEPFLSLPSLRFTGVEVAADAAGLKSLSIEDVSLGGGRA